MSVRVHKLAKELGLSSKDLIDRLHKLKVDVKGHMSALDEETVELARLEIEERTTDTVLANWPIIPVSPITGVGLGDVREHLASAVSRVGPPEDRQRPRLWVDRSFLIAGSGRHEAQTYQA